MLNLSQAGSAYPISVATGPDCNGHLIIEERGGVADVKCNSCGTVVDTVPIDRAGLRLIELGSEEICSARCPHCGATTCFTASRSLKRSYARNAAKGLSSGLFSDAWTTPARESVWRFRRGPKSRSLGLEPGRVCRQSAHPTLGPRGTGASLRCLARFERLK